jgi:hypothetical protein
LKSKRRQIKQCRISAKRRYFLAFFSFYYKFNALYADCIGAGGSGRKTVLELTEAEYPYGLAITENTILWTDWNR